MPRIIVEKVPPKVLRVVLHIRVHDADENDIFAHSVMEDVPVGDIKDLSDYTAEEVASILHTQAGEALAYSGDYGWLNCRFGQATVAEASWVDSASAHLPETCPSVLVFARHGNAERFERCLRSFDAREVAGGLPHRRKGTAGGQTLHEPG